MSYVRTSTANVLGHRPLGWYQRARFPLPTTSMSRPVNAAPVHALGWYDGPYPIYRQPELSRTRGMSGEWVPPGPPPRAAHDQGAVTYRVDPATGRYRLYNTDILPRGVFQQNTFQHPSLEGVSPVGAHVPAGHQLVQLPGGKRILSRNEPRRIRLRRRGDRKRGMATLNGCCGLGADTFVDPVTGCISDSDGNLLTCPTATGSQAPTSAGGIDPNAAIGSQVALITGAPPLTQQPSTAPSAPSPSLLQSVFAAFTQRPVVSTPGLPAPSQPSWFSKSTNIAGANIPNVALAGGLGLLAVMVIKKGKRR